VDIANEKFIANKKKTDQLFEAFKAKFYGEKPVVSNEAAVSSVEFDLYKELKCDEIKRVGHTSVAHGTSIVVFGGQGATASGTTSRLAALTIVSTAKDHSLEVIYKEDEKTAEAAPSARMQHSAVVVNNEMIVFGGRAGPTKPFNDVHAFKLDTRTWRAVDTVGGGPSPRYKHSCSVGTCAPIPRIQTA
jgi:tRNA wybutosine-synthesizing protein 3